VRARSSLGKEPRKRRSRWSSPSPRSHLAGRGTGASRHRAGVPRGAYLRAHQRYLNGWRTDIGTQVTKGQLLGEMRNSRSRPAAEPGEADLATARATKPCRRPPNVRCRDCSHGARSPNRTPMKRRATPAAKKAAADRRPPMWRDCTNSSRSSGSWLPSAGHYRAQHRHRGIDQCR